MPDTVNGLPLHPLVVHAVVVLLPLATIGVIAIAVRPAWRSRFGPVVVALAALAAVAIPVATSTGDQLAGRVGVPHEHEELGDSLLFFALPLLAAAVALVWTHRRTAATSSRRAARTVVAVIAVVVALANLVQVVRVGESGARAVWGGSSAVGRP
ncbi:DUF2231 domain-containing protein [Dactylosporangium sp. AC04546]|uniref:DUF2231 domain-containing protein n=1 Tax=Dactylosporangium sp. AC04546 TaxID=2862460 RepID=UPI001EDD3E78|nr:DUF2231 domain-containing protein [Dactylosporangium sp. AC04546]WVK78691.1 DUF2231 domain-containing protein [Dactylosporangium sp. AC04546]